VKSVALMLLLLAPMAHADDIDATVRAFVIAAASGEQSNALAKRWKPLLRADCVSVAGVAIDSADPANVRATVTYALAPRSEPTRITYRDEHLTLVLRSRNEGWTIDRATVDEDELAANIAAAAPSDRQALLDANPRLVNGSLARALYARCRILAMTSVPGSDALAETALRVAAWSGDAAAESLILNIRVNALRYTNVDAAIGLSEESLAIAERIGDPTAMATAMVMLGNILQLRNSRSSEAVELFQRAAKMKDCEDLGQIGKAQYNLAWERVVAYDMVAARRFAEQAVETAREAESLGTEGYAHQVLGLIYEQQNDLTMALHHYGAALDVMTRAGMESAMPRLQVLLAECYVGSNAKADRAARLLEEAEAGAARFHDEVTLAGCHRLRGLMAVKRGDVEEAECWYRDATKLFARNGYQANELYPAAEAALKKREYGRALALAVDASIAVNAEWSARTAGILAEASRASGDSEAAIALLRYVVETSDRVIADAAVVDRTQMTIMEEHVGAYRELAALLVDKGRIDEAFRVAEQAKGRVLLKTLQSGKPDAAFPIASAERQKEAALVQREAELSRALAAAAGAARRELEEQLAVARNALTSFRDALAVKYPQLAVSRRMLDLRTVGELSALLPADMVFVEYAVAGRRLDIYVLRPPRRGVTVRSVVIDSEALLAQVDRLARSFRTRDLAFDRRARELYTILIKPVADLLPNGSTICVVPDGPLWLVPFAALVDRQGRYLLQRHTITYAPSVHVYAAMHRVQQSRVRRPDPRLLAFGNPKLADATRAAVHAEYRDVDLGSLPEAEDEVRALRSIYGPRATVYTGRTATEARVRAEAPRFEILHFATHGVVDPVSPMYSRLILSTDDAASDGMLEAGEISRLSLRADLVVLSACDTARAGAGAGEGLIGIAWAFMVAGCPRTVATLTKVDSFAARELMVSFHRRLAGDRSRGSAAALRDAQLSLLADRHYAHPFYWASFVLIGADR